MRVLLLIILLVPMLATATDMQYLQSLRNTFYTQVAAEELDRSFHVYTMLPDSYSEHPDRRYPTIYFLDGGALLPMLSGYHRYLHLADEVPEAILVGISYGSNNFEGGNLRSTDYTAPSAEREWYGGAGAFQRFLERELLPLIETSYRADPDDRIVFGHSLGGQFVLYTAQTRPDLFRGHIASNPALHRNLQFFLDLKPGNDSSTGLFVVNGTENDERFSVPLLEWVLHWSKIPAKPWRLNFVELEGHTHMSTPPLAFRQGLHWLYAVDSSD